ncbi:MAG: glycosyltransferase family 39 protein [Candidatus Omnitrophota bacterium]
MSRQRQIFFILLSGLLIYLNSLRNNFVWDDILVIVNNDFIKGWALLGEIFSKPLFYLTNNEYLYYRPILTLSFVFDYSLWGLNPFGFHLTNIILHLCAGLLIYKLFDILFNESHLAFCAGFFFILHPLNTSVVNYVTSRADILLLIFSVFALILFLKAVNYKHYLLSLFCFSLALLSKESALVFPVLLVFAGEMHYLVMQTGQGSEPKAKMRRIWYIAFIAVAIGYIFLRTKIIGVGFNLSASGKIGILSILATFCMVILHYLKLIYFPFGLHMLSNIPIIQLQDNWFVLPLVIAIILAVFFIIYRLDKISFFLTGFFIIWVSPVALLSLKNPEYFVQQMAIMEHHWLYIPATALIVLIFYLIRRINKPWSEWFYKIIFISFALFLAIITVNENTYWKNNSSLFTQTIRYVKNSPTAYRNLGWIHLSKSDPVSAIQMYKTALGLKQADKDRAILYKELAYAYLSNNDAQKAGEAAWESIKLNPNYAASHGLLGLLYLEKEPNRGLEECKKALELDPFESLAFNNLLQQSRSDREITTYLIAKYTRILGGKRNFNAYRIYRSLGVVYLYADMDSMAMSNIKKALRINPYDVKTNNALAICYIKKGDSLLAERFFKRSLRLNPFDREVYGNLAFFYSELGRDKEAALMRNKAYSINLFD